MKHMSTWDLLDLAKDYREFARMFAATDESNERYLATRSKLAAIDTELLSRMPEGEFATVYVTYDKDSGRCHYCNSNTLWGDAPHAKNCPALPSGIVGFGPYMGEDNEYDSHLSLDDFNRQGFL